MASELKINVLGELSVFESGKPIALPASRKTRALLAYLLLTNRPQRRDRLCEIFWEIPDDPRGALRWSLSKLRRVVNSSEHERLVADRERVRVNGESADVDLVEISDAVTNPDCPHDKLVASFQSLGEPLLSGVDLPDQELFQSWLTSERAEVSRTRAQCASRLAAHPQTDVERALDYSRQWLELDPYSNHAGGNLLRQLANLGLDREAALLDADLAARFKKVGVAWPVEESQAAAPIRDQARVPDDNRAASRELLTRQRISFCAASDEVNIAYASVGSGPPLVKAANWLSHLELDWGAPIWSPLFRELARDHTFIRYDERGNGLSDWDVSEISFETFVTDLETVVEAMGLTRFPLLGISQGAAVSIEYAARYPERVSHLILFGGYAAGWRIDADEQTISEREAIMTLTATGWGRDDPTYRQIFSSTFMPSATPEELSWFNEFQRNTTSPENAVRFLSAFGDIDVRDRLADLDVPTLVIHSRDERRIPYAVGRDIAAQIPGAQLVSLDSDSHLLLGRELASKEFVNAVQRFLADD